MVRAAALHRPPSIRGGQSARAAPTLPPPPTRVLGPRPNPRPVAAAAGAGDAAARSEPPQLGWGAAASAGGWGPWGPLPHPPDAAGERQGRVCHRPRVPHGSATGIPLPAAGEGSQTSASRPARPSRPRARAAEGPKGNPLRPEPRAVQEDTEHVPCLFLQRASPAP